MQTTANTARNPLQTHVGYVNHTVQQGQFAMIGVQFEDVTSANLKLNDFIKGSIDPVECDFDDYAHYETANMIETYLGNDAYAFFYYVSNGWDPDANDGDGDWYNGWVDDSGYKALVELKPGDAIWLKARTGDLTFSTPGQVYMGETDITVEDGQFQMFANHKPVALDLNNPNQVGYTDIVAVECDFDDYAHYETANMIEVYLGNDAYAFFYYVSNGWDPDANDGDGDWYDGWVDDGGYKISSEAFIPVCVGCWAKARQGTFQINFK